MISGRNPLHLRALRLERHIHGSHARCNRLTVIRELNLVVAIADDVNSRDVSSEIELRELCRRPAENRTDSSASRFSGEIERAQLRLADDVK